jgi:hypothetical protein
MATSTQTPLAQYMVPVMYTTRDDAQMVTKVAKDVSILAMITVLAVIVVIIVSMYATIGFLRRALDKGSKKIGPIGQCAIEIGAAQVAYQNSADPDTGELYSKCAAKKAVGDVVGAPGTICPQVPAPYVDRPPYNVYVDAQCS